MVKSNVEQFISDLDAIESQRVKKIDELLASLRNSGVVVDEDDFNTEVDYWSLRENLTNLWKRSQVCVARTSARTPV